jgi:hypothetical protein
MVLEVGAFATNKLKVAQSSAITGSGTALGSNAPPAAAQTSQATVPTTATLTAANLAIWLGVV